MMKRPPKSSSSRARSKTPSSGSGGGRGETSGSTTTSNDINSNNVNDVFSPTRPFLYVTEDVKPWQVSIDKSTPIIVCDPVKIPSGYVVHPTCTSISSSQVSTSTPATTTTTATTTLSAADLKKHGWLRDFQAVSLTWVLNCISCSLMGKGDVEMLYGSSNPEEIRQLDQAWDSWRSKRS